jgi:phenylpropionate dioxygenase-like ring-hydroxylating dioxygenase large terminal subunit
MLSKADNELLCRVGAGTPMGEYLRRYWVPAVLSAQLPGPDCDPVEVRLLGEDLVAFRDSAGRPGLVQALCPHRQAPLVYGRNEELGLRCIYHGWKFDVGGTCVDMPNEPAETQFVEKVRPIGYPVVERGDIVWVYLGPPGRQPAQLPGLELIEVPSSQRVFTKYTQDCNYAQAIEGDIDDSHLSFLHRNLAELKTPEAFEGRVRYLAQDRSPRFIVEPMDYGLMVAMRRDADADSYYWRVQHFQLPWYTNIWGDELDNRRFRGNIWVPVDDEHTEVWSYVWAPDEALTDEERTRMVGAGPRPHMGTFDATTGKLRASRANHFLQDRQAQRSESYTGIWGAREQDAAVQGGMGPIVDRTREHLGASDTAIIGMRRALLNEAKALMRGVEPTVPQRPELYRARAWHAVMPRRDPAPAAFLSDARVLELTTPSA